ncbi:MAG: FAD-dependent oxidoreductase [Desulfobacterales bacterium]
MSALSQLIQISVPAEHIHDSEFIRQRISSVCKGPFVDYRIQRRSIDARKRCPEYILQVKVYPDAPPPEEDDTPPKRAWPTVAPDEPVIIVGAGPAGYFAALKLISMGVCPVVLERGKDVRSRRIDIGRLHRKSIVDPDSNYCFGEGGAGTYSDGKLYTRSTKRGDVQSVLRLFVEHGASPDILIDVHPHIGSNVLPRLVEQLRNTILAHGGQVLFQFRVSDLIVSQNRAVGVRTEDGREFTGRAVILATGHSARDVYRMLHRQAIRIEAKPFALGVRIEHPQSLIDQIFYHHSPRHQNLPAASYRMVCQVEGRGVYSFCMCPGGFIVPASTAPGELVLNGMSMSRQDARYANAGMVVEIRPADWSSFESSGPLAALEFQRQVEVAAFEAGKDKTQRAPAQRVTDFVAGRISASLPDTSYTPGVISAPVHDLLPESVSSRLREALTVFGKKHKGYFTGEAMVLAVESRTSSPVRIPRDPVTWMHPQVQQLYPCGEGAGYAGGIVSSAIDGQLTAQAIVQQLR